MLVDPDIYVVLWSPHQNVVQVETVGDMLKTNRSIYKQGMAGDFIVMSFAPDREAARADANALIKDRNRRLEESQPAE